MTTCHLHRTRSLAATLSAMFIVAFAPAPNAVAEPAKLDPPVKPSIEGKFVGNGRPAALKFVTVQEREGFGGGNAVRIIFTEKDPSASKKLDHDAVFGNYGSALVISVSYEGDVFGCEVAHTAHKKKSFSTSGTVKMKEFEIAGGNITGRVSSGGERDAFGDKWEVDLKFAAPLPEKLRQASLVPPKAVAQTPEETPAMPESDPAGPAVSVRNLPLPKDAKNVQYKAVVKQIQLTSGQSVAAVTRELGAALKEQGWMEGPGSMKGAKNAILKYGRGDANLNIMIQPAASGSTVKIFTSGLDWDNAGAGSPPAAK